MAGLEIAGAVKSFGAVEVLRGVDVTVADGEFLVIVGPSGCGKSTLLRAIAGLEELSEGAITIDGRRIDHLPPADRGIAMVFQSYALYPHLSVRDNLGFALSLQKRPAAEIAAAVADAARMLDIEHLLDRKPAELSGGQRQRVAIGRAIVRQPRIFLFDEPLSNLDAALRVRMRYEFAALHKALATTTVYVTHDQVEAMTLADRILVLRAGQVEQFGTPAALYETPANLFVAGFIGSPRMNIAPGRLVEAHATGARVRLRGGLELSVAVDARALEPGAMLSLGVRPEHLERASDAAGFAATIRFVERLGGSASVHLDSPDSDDPLIWQTRDDRALTVGDPVCLAPDAEHFYLFDAAGNALPRFVV